MGVEAAAAPVDLLAVTGQVAAVQPEVVADQGEMAVRPIGRVGLVGHAHLAEVALGGVDPRVVPGLADRRQQDADQQGDDRDHHEQLNDRKAVTRPVALGDHHRPPLAPAALRAGARRPLHHPGGFGPGRLRVAG
jgi:hypothetical protein